MTDTSDPIIKKFNTNRETSEFKHKLKVDTATFAKEIRKSKLVLKLKKKKRICFIVELDDCDIKL